MPLHASNLREEIRQQALALGLDVAGFAPPVPPPHHESLLPWLAEGRQAGMAWLARNPARRQNPTSHLPDLATILVVGINCRPPGNPLDYLQDASRLGIASYARHGDYHLILQDKCRALISWLNHRLGQQVNHRIMVDWGAVMEKPLAVAAGLGWQGKHALLVNRQHGSWLHLAELLLPIPLAPDTPSRDHCGSCTRCQTACPTLALERAYSLDTRLCLAYHTVENPGSIPRPLRPLLANRVFGCDDCLVACPWNRFAPLCQQPELLPQGYNRPEYLLDYVGLDESQFLQLFQGTPLIRPGWQRFLRNLAVALGNWPHEQSIIALQQLLSSPFPLVREHAVWGLGHLFHAGWSLGEEALHRLNETEQDENVLQELAWALTGS
ncbi:MAG: tRNA epoxyqueuosine(34) reductase QueG [Magnetococcales bacterium]|nr:tRNA epoxyqueuosine(34) reductase QueG [Magnetococcales bacterium]NGZ26859.1 tRNA epoxyqueuosine(34) reductase QueG [Magnetococcales bacterium]